MLSLETVSVLSGSKATLLRSIKKEARAQFWNLDKNLWLRNGLLAQCLLLSLDGIGIVLNQAATGGDDAPAPAGKPHMSLCTFAGMQECIDRWKDSPLSAADMRAFVLILRKQLISVYHKHRVRCPLAVIDGALSCLLNSVYAHRIEQLEHQLSAHREETVTARHLGGRFLANASHELRTPLTAVLGFSELLLESTYGPLNDGQRNAVGHIENSAQNLCEIVNNLLDLMHIRTGKLHLQYRQVAIAAVLRNVYDILVPLAERRAVVFREEIPDSLGSIEADEAIVRHIVYYLLSSALRATPQGGEVIFSARRTDNVVTIITYDTALHLPPEAIENMKDAYPILENSPARGYEGWEIGLPLVQRYVEMHAGELEMESVPEHGTTFRVHLPVQKPA